MREIDSKFDGIILDIDGTIWNTAGLICVAWNRAIDITGFDVKKLNAQGLQKEFGKPMDVIAKDLWPELDDEKRNVLVANCLTEEQIELEKNTIDVCYEGVVETVKELSASQNFFVVSNCQAGYTEVMLEKTGLKPYIIDYEYFGRTGKGKAENIMLIKARNNLLNPVYVGDTQGDSDACFQAGIPFIWAAYGFGEVKNFYRKIDSFSQLKDVLE